MFFVPRKAENTKKFSKFAKNEVNAVKVAVRSTALMPCQLRGVLAVQDTHGNSRGAWGTLGWGGGVLYIKNFYGLELLKKNFLDKEKKSDNWHPLIPPTLESDKNHFLKLSLTEGEGGFVATFRLNKNPIYMS